VQTPYDYYTNISFVYVMTAEITITAHSCAMHPAYLSQTPVPTASPESEVSTALLYLPITSKWQEYFLPYCRKIQKGGRGCALNVSRRPQAKVSNDKFVRVLSCLL
jgi:hypothetical protein